MIFSSRPRAAIAGITRWLDRYCVKSVASDVLARITVERPRLMASRTAIARTQRLLRRNRTARRWQQEVTEQADRILPLPPLTMWKEPRKEVGAAPPSRVGPPQSLDGLDTPLDIARCFSLRIQTLGITWLLTEDPRYCDRAKSELLAICSFQDWKGDEFLVTAEMAFGAAVGYDWLYNFLTDNERQQIAQAILEKAIEPGLDQFAASAFWTKTPMNWNLVCNGALMIAALSVLEADPKAELLFSLCRDSVPIGFNVYRPDGGWVEGPGYWHYATQYAIYLLDSLSTALRTDLGLDASPGLSDTGLFRLHAAGPSGKLFNFADSEDHHSGGYWLFWLARRYHHPVDAWIEDHRGQVHPMDLLWFDQHTRDPCRLPPSGRFRVADVVMLRGDWRDPNTTYLGVKGGANDACEHGHYDLGSFVIDCGGVRWAIDLGPDNYQLPDYFKPEKRSCYYRTSTIGHNTIVINGECQPHACRALFTHVRFDEKISSIVMDLSAAYPNAASALRGFAVIDRRDVLIVDEIMPKGPLSTVDWQMHTTAQVGLGDATATLTHPARNDAGQPSQCYVRIVDPSLGAWGLRSAAPTEPQGQNPNTGVAKLVLRLEQVAKPIRLAVLLSPDAGACATPELPLALRRSLSEWA